MKTQMDCRIEIHYCELVELKTQGVVVGWTYSDPKENQDQKKLHSVEVREYRDSDGNVDVIEDYDFQTWDEADAKITELTLKYPDAEVYDD